MPVHIIHVSPIILPENCIFRREPPRASSYRQVGYEEQFDFRTLSYDVFSYAGKTVLSGPPLFNLKKGFIKGKFLIDGIDVSRKLKTWALERHQRMELGSHGEKLSVSCFGEHFELAINPSCNSFFSGKRVLLTMSRNNKLEWIRDWVAFYVANHGVNGVLIYDNNSSSYSVDELAQTLTVFEGVEIVIVPWGFKYGPGKYPGRARETLSDSKFCQLGGLEHARFRFLSEAAWVINADVDELLIVTHGSVTNDFALNPKLVGFSFKSRWVDALGGYGENRPKSFADYFHFDRNGVAGHRKWIVVPARVAEKHQWTVHSVQGAKAVPAGSQRYFAHFHGINTNWKSKRNVSCRYDASTHEIDGALVGCMLKAWPEKIKRSMSDFMASFVQQD
jgi:hypothetical protein